MDPSIADVPVTEIGTFSEIAAACCQHDPLRRPRMREVRHLPGPIPRTNTVIALHVALCHAARLTVVLTTGKPDTKRAISVQFGCHPVNFTTCDHV
jgi:hypothetical protein